MILAILTSSVIDASAIDSAAKPPSNVSQHAPVVVDPNWVKKPSNEDIEHAFPPAAAAARVKGRVVVQCKVRIDGNVDRCVVLSEDPPAWGFAEATLKVIPVLRMRPRTEDGVPVDGAAVTIPFNWSPTHLDDQPDLTKAAPTIAEAQARDPEALVLARRVAELTAGFDGAVGQAEQAYKGSIFPLFDRQDPVRSAAFTEAFRLSFNDFVAERRDRVAAALVFTFSRDELMEIKAFLETHAGAAFVHKFSDALVASYGRNEELVLALIDAWQTRYCAKVSCDDKDLESFRTILRRPSNTNPQGNTEAAPTSKQ